MTAEICLTERFMRFNEKGFWSKYRNKSSCKTYEPPHDKNNKMTFSPSEDSDQPGHPPSLMRVFAVRMKKHWILSYQLSALRKRWSDWTAAQAESSLGAQIILLVLS